MTSGIGYFLLWVMCGLVAAMIIAVFVFMRGD